MKTSIAPVLSILLASVVALHAQSPNANSKAAASANANAAPSGNSARGSDPEQAWNNLAKLVKPARGSLVSTRRGKDKAPDEVKAKLRQQAERSWQAVEEARQFYVRFPSHPKALEARKLEAVNALRALRDGDAAHDQFARNTATAFRDNKAFPLTDRVEVALELERYLLSQKIKSKAVKNQPSEWLKLGENLEKEYGDSALIQAYYIQLARRGEPAVAHQIATKVARSTAASQETRAEARSILDRAAMIGKTLPVRLPRIRGGEIDLARQQNKITAVVAWAPADPESLVALNTFKSGLPEGVQIIYLSMGNVSTVLSAQGRLPVPGVLCYSPTGRARAEIELALNLRYAPAPCVCVLDRAGKVVAIGRVEELAALLAKALG